MSKKAKLATVWLDGCSGCHMSFLDIDERILAVAKKADLVYRLPCPTILLYIQWFVACDTTIVS